MLILYLNTFYVNISRPYVYYIYGGITYIIITTKTKLGFNEIAHLPLFLNVSSCAFINKIKKKKFENQSDAIWFRKRGEQHVANVLALLVI